MAAVFPSATVLAPATSPVAINPSELAARGAAAQAAIIRGMPSTDRERLADPDAGVRTHLQRAVGVQLGADAAAPFQPVLLELTAIPAWRRVAFDAPAGDDVLVRICEGVSHVVVSKPEPKAKGAKAEKEDEDADDEDDSDDEDEETREKAWKVDTLLGELRAAGVAKKKGQIEVDIGVGVDQAVEVRVRPLGADEWATLLLEAPAGSSRSAANGKA